MNLMNLLFSLFTLLSFVTSDPHPRDPILDIPRDPIDVGDLSTTPIGPYFAGDSILFSFKERYGYFYGITLEWVVNGSVVQSLGAKMTKDRVYSHTVEFASPGTYNIAARYKAGKAVQKYRFYDAQVVISPSTSTTIPSSTTTTSVTVSTTSSTQSSSFTTSVTTSTGSTTTTTSSQTTSTTSSVTPEPTPTTDWDCFSYHGGCWSESLSMWCDSNGCWIYNNGSWTLTTGTIDSRVPDDARNDATADWDCFSYHGGCWSESLSIWCDSNGCWIYNNGSWTLTTGTIDSRVPDDARNDTPTDWDCISYHGGCWCESLSMWCDSNGCWIYNNGSWTLTTGTRETRIAK